MEKSTDIQKCYINDTDHALLSWDSYHLSIYTLTSTNYPKQGVHAHGTLQAGAYSCITICQTTL